MGMEMHLRAEQKLAQRLQMSPQMYQTIEILALPIAELQERIEQEITENPLLERAEEMEPEENETPVREEQIVPGSVEDVRNRKETEISDYLDEARDQLDELIASNRTKARPDEDEDPKMAAMMNVAAPISTLEDHLNQQVRLLDLPDRDMAILETLFSVLDRRGYLPSDYAGTFQSGNENGEFDPHVSEEEIGEAVRLLQTLDPAGVGARTVVECLLLQIDRLEGDFSIERVIVEKHFEELAANKLPDIAHAIGASHERVNQAYDFIRRNLNPKPGLVFDTEASQYIVADVIVRERYGELDVYLNDSALPRLAVNKRLIMMLGKNELSKEDKDYISRNRESARWLISAIEQRKRTLLRIAESVTRVQKGFFLHGWRHLKTLLMKDLAVELGIDVSTVSRAVSGKYVDCPQGIVPFRDLFTAGYTGTEGQSVSDEAVKQELKKIVANEDKAKPLSDDAISEIFRTKNIPISRRTITKYRAELKIPNTRIRRQF